MHPNKLYDRKHHLVYPVEVRSEGDGYVGKIDLSAAPSEVRALFEKYAELVNEQVFSLLDEVEDEVERLELQVGFQDSESVRPVEDLQIFGEDVSFRLVS